MELNSKSIEIGLESSWSMEIGLESSWPISQWNTQGIPFKINRNCLERNPYGMPFKINRNWLGELLVYVHMESLWNPFFNQWKLVWIAPGLFSHGLLKEFWSKSMEMGLESNTFI